MMLTVLAFRRGATNTRRRCDDGQFRCAHCPPAGRKSQSSLQSSPIHANPLHDCHCEVALATTCFSVHSANGHRPPQRPAVRSVRLVIAAAPGKTVSPPLVSVRAIRSLRSALRKRALFLLVRLVRRRQAQWKVETRGEIGR